MSPRVIHFEKPWRIGAIACGASGAEWRTPRPENVTCKRCLRTIRRHDEEIEAALSGAEEGT